MKSFTQTLNLLVLDDIFFGTRLDFFGTRLEFVQVFSGGIRGGEMLLRKSQGGFGGAQPPPTDRDTIIFESLRWRHTIRNCIFRYQSLDFFIIVGEKSGF